MTYRQKSDTGRHDRPALTNVDITPEMINAGVAELCLFDLGDRPELIVEAVFSAMAKMAPAALSP